MPISRFLSDERGEISPVSYLFAVMLSLLLIFFTLDLGLRKGARLAVEYAAYCAARAAATQIPRNDRRGACLSDGEYKAIKEAAAACLASVVSKRGTIGLEIPGSPALALLVARAASQTEVRVLRPGGGPLAIGQCLGKGDVGAEVQFDHHLAIPLSPFNWVNGGHVSMVARASAMLQTLN